MINGNQAASASSLRLPMQSAPIERTTSSAGLTDGSGIEASGWLDVVGDIAKVALPIAGSAFGI